MIADLTWPAFRLPSLPQVVSTACTGSGAPTHALEQLITRKGFNERVASEKHASRCAIFIFWKHQSCLWSQYHSWTCQSSNRKPCICVMWPDLRLRQHDGFWRILMLAIVSNLLWAPGPTLRLRSKCGCIIFQAVYTYRLTVLTWLRDPRRFFVRVGGCRTGGYCVKHKCHCPPARCFAEEVWNIFSPCVLHGTQCHSHHMPSTFCQPAGSCVRWPLHLRIHLQVVFSGEPVTIQSSFSRLYVYQSCLCLSAVLQAAAVTEL